jgi:hypothetical protein
MFVYRMDDDFVDSILGPLFTFLIMAAIVAALAWFGYRRWRMRYGAAHWTLTEATIQSEFAGNASSPGLNAVLGGGLSAAAARNLFHAVLQYSYQVAGEFYSGYFVLGEVFSSREDASAAARPWLEKKIFVRYKPERPHESAFLRDDGAPRGSRSLGDQPPASSDTITLSLK